MLKIPSLTNDFLHGLKVPTGGVWNISIARSLIIAVISDLQLLDWIETG